MPVIMVRMAEHCPCTFLAIFVLYKRYFAYMKTLYHLIALLLSVTLLAGCGSMDDPETPLPESEDFAVLIADYDSSIWSHDAPRPTILEVYRPNCPSCQKLKPHYESLVKEYEGKVQFHALNTISEDRDRILPLIKKFGIKSVPTLIFVYKNGSFVIVHPTSTWKEGELLDGMRAETEKMLRSYKR